MLSKQFAFGLGLQLVLALLRSILESRRGILVWDPGWGSCCGISMQQALARYTQEEEEVSGATDDMNLLAWNYLGMGGSLGSPKMLHLHRLIYSTKAQVIFVSETRNSKLSKTDLINRFNVNNNHVVHANGLLGGLWLLLNYDVDVEVLESSPNFLFCMCDHKFLHKRFGLVCVYGGPHHQITDLSWRQVQNIFTKYQNMPIICMVDLYNIMDVKEKLGPRPAIMGVLSLTFVA